MSTISNQQSTLSGSDFREYDNEFLSDKYAFSGKIMFSSNDSSRVSITAKEESRDDTYERGKKDTTLSCEDIGRTAASLSATSFDMSFQDTKSKLSTEINSNSNLDISSANNSDNGTSTVNSDNNDIDETHEEEFTSFESSSDEDDDDNDGSTRENFPTKIFKSATKLLGITFIQRFDSAMTIDSNSNSKSVALSNSSTSDILYSSEDNDDESERDNKRQQQCASRGCAAALLLSSLLNDDQSKYNSNENIMLKLSSDKLIDNQPQNNSEKNEQVETVEGEKGKLSNICQNSNNNREEVQVSKGEEVQFLRDNNNDHCNEVMKKNGLNAEQEEKDNNHVGAKSSSNKKDEMNSQIEMHISLVKAGNIKRKVKKKKEGLKLESKFHGKTLRNIRDVSFSMNKDIHDETSSDFETNSSSILFDLIIKRKWKEAIQRVQKVPGEAQKWVNYKRESICIEKNEENNLFAFYYLPLHAACWCPNVPIKLLIYLLDAYPEGVQKVTELCKLPIHIASEVHCNPEVISLLLNYFPDSVKVQDGQGYTPIIIAIMYNDDQSKTEIIETLANFSDKKISSKETKLKEAYENGSDCVKDNKDDESYLSASANPSEANRKSKERRMTGLNSVVKKVFKNVF
eukprot:CAMPEP_0184867868 /NCGR_PEP_ID=MMETSP0580-20130426/28013_1 /TAXON_ID=1118495 /ORGANISM="Dactyliosolen fragilissimus" /LENGTH=629 /DNA_ID=CAMNT_0027368347 /DNA_START=253 /DNA_END=2142 /DNA_ORIENTATION=-